MTPEQKKQHIATWRTKYPEKYKAIGVCKKLPRTAGFELHHWSYNNEHWQDVIHLSIKSHKLAHRFILRSRTNDVQGCPNWRVIGHKRTAH